MKFCSMPPSPWGLLDEDLFDAIFPFLAQDDKVLAKARLVNRLWRARADASVEELEPRQRVAEPKLSQLLRRFTGLTAINAAEPWRIRISDETIPALLVSSIHPLPASRLFDPPMLNANRPMQCAAHPGSLPLL